MEIQNKWKHERQTIRKCVVAHDNYYWFAQQCYYTVSLAYFGDRYLVMKGKELNLGTSKLRSVKSFPSS